MNLLQPSQCSALSKSSYPTRVRGIIVKYKSFGLLKPRGFVLVLNDVALFNYRHLPAKAPAQFINPVQKHNRVVSFCTIRKRLCLLNISYMTFICVRLGIKLEKDFSLAD